MHARVEEIESHYYNNSHKNNCRAKLSRAYLTQSVRAIRSGSYI